MSRSNGLWQYSLLTLLIVFVASGNDQIDQPAIHFEAALVKANHTSSEDNDLSITAGRLTIINFPLQIVISKAYVIEPERILGPSWLATERYDIVATAPEASDRSQIREMLKTLLFENFGLKVHAGSKEVPVYDLVVDQIGLRIKESSAHQPVRVVRSRGAISATNMTMTMLASMLSREIHQGVNDKTGLQGEYDLALSWNSDDLTPAMPAAASDASIFTALREQLGLRLDLNKKASVEILVVDHVERLSER